jgi:hypothetical protein
VMRIVAPLDLSVLSVKKYILFFLSILLQLSQ